jgi:UDP-N-acetylmuramate dehydrogenase
MNPKNQKSQKIIQKLGRNRVKINEPLAKHTTFGIGGPADLFYEAKTTKEVVGAVNLVQEVGIDWLILGAGSNLLVSDDGVRGLVIKVGLKKYKVHKESGSFNIVAGAGMSLPDLVSLTQKLGLAGLEFLVGIPGTIGGAIWGNAGAWQNEISDLVESVRVVSQEGKAFWLPKNECRFAYRNSRFKRTKEAILEVKLKLKKGDRKKIARRIKTFQEKRSQQPQGLSAGCVFVNPKPQPAGALIDQCGLKGKTIGKAQISPQHANFIINLGGAKAKDVMSLIQLAKKEVKRKFNLELKEEIQLVGFS